MLECSNCSTAAQTARPDRPLEELLLTLPSTNKSIHSDDVGVIPSQINVSHPDHQSLAERFYLDRRTLPHSSPLLSPPVYNRIKSLFKMLVPRVLSRISRSGLNQFRLLASCRSASPPLFSNDFYSACDSPNKVTLLSRSMRNTIGSRGFWFSSSASHQSSEKEAVQPADEKVTVGENGNTSDSAAEAKLNTETNEDDTEIDLSKDDLVKLVAEKEELLKAKHEEIKRMQDKVLRSYADMENVMDRTKREAENSKKFAIQNFAKSLLDVADNLGRAASVVKDSFLKIDQSKDTVGAVPLLKTLLEGVEMTDKQLLEIFRKFGLEKFDPMNGQFDPNRHNAVFQLPDASKPAGTITAVLKPGYTLHDRVIRPAEVGVTEVPNSETDQGAPDGETNTPAAA